MKRHIVLGVLVGVLLAAGFVWVVVQAPIFSTPPAVLSANEATTVAPSAANEVSNTARQVPSPVAATGAPVVAGSLNKEELQTLITAAGQGAIKSAIRRVGPAVVQINVTRQEDVRNPFDDLFKNDPFFERFFDQQTPQQQQVSALGSGFFVEFDGQVYLLTNNHVSQNANSIQVVTEQNWKFTARVVGADAQIDVAVLQVDDFKGKTVPRVVLGDSDKMEIGDWVVAIGNPLGLTHTVTAGIVSALGRSIPNPNTSSRFRSLIQTDAAINPGNSGGPLVNALGEVIGINTLIATNAEGLNFAVNINEIKRSLAGLIHDGKLTRAWLGVFIQDLNEELAQQFGVSQTQGVLISDVVPGAPAEGVLQSGDVVTGVDGVKVGSVGELQDEIMFKAVGSAVTLDVIRDGQPLSLSLVLNEKPSDEQLGSKARPAPSQPEVLEKFGLKLTPNSPDLAQRLALSTEKGVVIVGVEPSSRAYWAAPRPQQGDVVIEVNRQAVETLEDWNALVETLGERDRVVLTLVRQGRTLYVALP